VVALVWPPARSERSRAVTDNPYRPPEADLSDGRHRGQAEFYVVARRKFAILYLATAGIYVPYWFWRNWRQVRDASGEPLWPIPRAIFAIFFTHALFERVRRVMRDRQVEHRWAAASLATQIVLLLVVSNIFDLLAARNLWSPQSDILSLAFLPLLLPFFLRAQDALNASQNDPDGERNRRLSIANYVVIAIGALVWLLSIELLLDKFGMLASAGG
jgi:hypothetical protein